MLGRPTGLFLKIYEFRPMIRPYHSLLTQMTMETLNGMVDTDSDDYPGPHTALPIGRVGILEDDRFVREVLTRFLKSMRAEVVAFVNGRQAIKAVMDHEIDMILVDLGLPNEDGLDVIRNIRIVSKLPILIVSGRVEAPAITAGLDAGADDYVRKPISFEELGARIRAVLRRIGQAESGQVPAAEGSMELAVDNIRLDSISFTLHGPDGHNKLTELEARLLSMILRHQGKVVTRDQICRALWGTPWDPSNRTLDVHMSHIRKKLSQVGARSELIRAKRNNGYYATAYPMGSESGQEDGADAAAEPADNSASPL